MQDAEFIADFLREVRSYQPGLPPQSLLELVAYEEASFPKRGDLHAPFRMSVLFDLHKSFSLEDRAFIRFLLTQEIIYHQNLWAFDHSMYFCGFLLFALGEVEDIQLLWQAKTTSFDTSCGFHAQLLVGAGVTTTLNYLQRADEGWSQKAREHIERCQKAGSFNNLEGFKRHWNTEFQRRASLKRATFL